MSYRVDSTRTTFLCSSDSESQFFCKTWPAGRLKLGNQHPDTMMSIYNLADLLKSMEKFEEAEELFREELAACDSPSMLSVSFSLRRCVQKPGS